jgi:hypothetical protein
MEKVTGSSPVAPNLNQSIERPVAAAILWYPSTSSRRRQWLQNPVATCPPRKPYECKGIVNGISDGKKSPASQLKSGQPNMALCKTLDTSFSLEASGELGENWASDTGDPIVGYYLSAVPEPSSLAIVACG